MKRSVLILAAAFSALEGFDLSAYGVTVPSLLHDGALGVDESSAGTVGSLVAVGMLVGAALSALLVSRTGSRRLVFAGAGVFSLGMLACAAAPTVEVLGGARFVVGIGLGAVLPTLTAYVTALCSPKKQARTIGLMMAGYALGALAAPLLGSALFPGASWRWIYLIGAVPTAVVIPIAIVVFPPDRQVTSGETASDRLGLRQLGALFTAGTWLPTVLFWGISFCGLLLVFGISTWLPTIMQTAGYSIGSSLLQTSAMWVGAGVGMIVGGRIADSVGIKQVTAGAFGIGVVCLVVLSVDPALAVVFIAMFLSGLGLIGCQALTNAYVVSYYPEDVRGPAIGWALAVGRLGAIVGPKLGGAVLASSLAVEWNFYVFAVVGLLGAVLAAAVPMGRRLRSANAPGSRMDDQRLGGALHERRTS